MNKGIGLLLIILGVCTATAAFAAPPDCVGNPDKGPKAGRGEPPGKSTILHCGCASDGQVLEYLAIKVSSKSRGHDNHVAGSIDSCFDGVDTYTDFVRSGSDCQIDGSPLRDPIDPCTDQEEFQVCGTAVID